MASACVSRSAARDSRGRAIPTCRIRRSRGSGKQCSCMCPFARCLPGHPPSPLRYPVAYVVLILPIAACRWSATYNGNVPFAATIFADAVFLLSGTSFRLFSPPHLTPQQESSTRSSTPQPGASLPSGASFPRTGRATPPKRAWRPSTPAHP